MRYGFAFIVAWTSFICLSFAQPHSNAHAHNDYEHLHPLKDALNNGFISVEADVHLQNNQLKVSHNTPHQKTPTLEQLYLIPLDSILRKNSGRVYQGSEETFYLMIDIKTNANPAYEAICKAIAFYPSLLCGPDHCPVKVFISGNRPMALMDKEGYKGIGIDGRPDDLGKDFTIALMPVISDHFKNWSDWNGSQAPSQENLQRIRDLAKRVHAEGRKLRLWAIPDHETAWAILLDCGVDLINTDRLTELNAFLNRRGL